VWQSIYEELKSENFEIISVAQDTGGEEAAGYIFDDANVSYTAIIDVNHQISSLYNLVNVPSGVWIDEQGKIMRINEGTYAKEHMNGAWGTNDYVPIVRDWVAKGADSEHVWDRSKGGKVSFNAHLKPSVHNLRSVWVDTTSPMTTMRKQNNTGPWHRN